MKSSKKSKPQFTSRNACAYPFLYEDIKVVDHEIITDEIATLIGLLHSQVTDHKLQKDLMWLCELTWDINGSVRGKCVITKPIFNKIEKRFHFYEAQLTCDRKRFTLPVGTSAACYAEVIRNRFKAAVRVLYLVSKKTPTLKINRYLFDSLNLLSNFFYVISLYIRQINKETLITYKSKSYR